MPDNDDNALQENLNIEIYKALRAHELELNRATAAFEHAALRHTTLLNGGALVAFLTLLGAIWKDDNVPSLEQVGLAILLWSVGLFMAALATVFAYRSQRMFSIRARKKREAFEVETKGNLETTQELVCKLLQLLKDAKAHQKNAERMALASLLFFLLGVIAALYAITP